MSLPQVQLEKGDLDAEVRRVVDEYRSRCLWFLREDYYPRSSEEILRVLRQIERYGDREAFRRTTAIRQWLSRSSNARSAGS